MEEINIFMNGTVVTRDDANRVIKDGVVVCQGVCAVLCVVVYFSLTKEDDGLTRAQRKELKAARKAAAKAAKGGN